MITNKNNINKQKIQEEEYSFPYHYIPEITSNGVLSQAKYWSWGFRYLGGMTVVFDLLKEMNFNSLIDIGCGDGRFLSELNKVYPDIDICGVDFSKRAIAFAKAMNPEISSCYLENNIIEETVSETYDVATLIEVLEHIHPGQVDSFVKAIALLLNEKGYLIITVPHKNKSVQSKHYQHFNCIDLERILSTYFKNITFVLFDKKSKVMSLLQRLIGGQGNYFVLTYPKVLSIFYNTYKQNYLYASKEVNCGRVAVICKKK